MRNGATQCEWCRTPEARGGFWEILKKSVSGVETCLGRRRLAFACSWRPLWRVPHVLEGSRWKSQHRKIVPLFPYVEEPLNSREEENLVFWFGAQFNSTLNFTQSGWLILFNPDLKIRLAKQKKKPVSLAGDGDQNRRSSDRPYLAMLFS